MINWEKIKQEWETTDISFVDLAEKHNIKTSTIRSRKNREKWQRNGSATQRKNVATEKKNVAKKKVKPIAEEVKSVLENDNLTDKQKLFCLHYVKCFNATKAYQKAYEVDYNTAASIAYRLMENDGVKKEIYRLKQGRLNRAMFDEMDLFQMYLDIACADITNYVEFGREEVPVMGPFGPITVKDDDTGEKTKLTKVINTVKFKESTEVDGTLISEVKQGKDGASIKLSDRLKAMDWLDKHMGLATEEQKAKIDKLKAETMQITEKDKEKEPPTINIIDTWSGEDD